MDDHYKPIATAATTLVLILLLSLTLVAYLSGGVEAVGAMLATVLILAIPLVLLVGGLLYFQKWIELQ